MQVLSYDSAFRLARFLQSIVTLWDGLMYKYIICILKESCFLFTITNSAFTRHYKPLISWKNQTVKSKFHDTRKCNKGADLCICFTTKLWAICEELIARKFEVLPVFPFDLAQSMEALTEPPSIYCSNFFFFMKFHFAPFVGKLVISYFVHHFSIQLYHN